MVHPIKAGYVILAAALLALSILYFGSVVYPAKKPLPVPAVSPTPDLATEFMRSHPQGGAISPGGKYRAVNNNLGMVGLWDAATGDPLYLLHDGRPPISEASLVFSPDARWLVGSWIYTLYIWDGETGVSKNFRFGPNGTYAFSPDSRHLALFYCTGTVVHGQCLEPVTGLFDRQNHALESLEGLELVVIYNLSLEGSRTLVAEGCRSYADSILAVCSAQGTQRWKIPDGKFR